MQIQIARRSFLVASAGAAFPALAQTDWPNRPVRLVLPFSAGGPGDITTRLLAQGLSRQLGQSVIVDNKPGAGGVIGTDHVAKSQPDGYTFLVAGNPTITTPLLRAKMPYAEADLVPLAITSSAPSVMCVSTGNTIRSLKDIAPYARSRPNGLTFGTAGTGSSGHFVAEMVRRSMNVPVTVVHFKSGSEGITALIGGQIDMVSEAAVGVLGYLRGGKVRAIGVTSDSRLQLLADVPTTAEQGYPAISMRHWIGLYAPSGVPERIQQRLALAMQKALETDMQLRSQLESSGYFVHPLADRPAVLAFLDAEKQRLGKIVADAKMSED